MKTKSLVGAALTGLVTALCALIFVDLLQAPTMFLKGRGKTDWTPLQGFSANAHLAAIKSKNVSKLESGNIADIKRKGKYQFTMSLRSDNDDALPPYWRQWWYLSLDQVGTDKETKITLGGKGQWNKYLPVYSYDNKNWRHFSESDISRPTKLKIEIKKKFLKDQVWLARYHPYTYSDLQNFSAQIKKSKFVQQESLGESSEGREMLLWRISNHSSSASKKSRVIIHARTHPGELASSWMLEGLINYLISNQPGAAAIRNKIILDIVPMLNPDGVVAGNNRVTTYGVNLEGKWYTKASNPLLLDLEKVPHEVRLFYRKIRESLEEKAPITMALNLHSSAGEPQDGVFFFPHFGPKTLGYRTDEASLYNKQIDFINAFSNLHGKSWFNAPPKDGTRAFIKKSVPETWWWNNFKDKVMAISIESTYGLAGNCNRWMTPDDLKLLGSSLAKAIGAGHGVTGLKSVRDPCKGK